MNRRQTKGKVGPVPMTMVNVKDGIPQKSIEARGIVLIASSRFRSIGASGLLSFKQTIKWLNNCHVTARLEAQSLIVAH